MSTIQSITFFGADQYSAIVLEALLSSPLRSTIYDLQTVVTDRPKPKGREQIAKPNPVEKMAKEQNIIVQYYPDNTDEMSTFVSHLLSTTNDPQSTLGIIASFGHILPAVLISAFPDGIVNIHPSLLPQYRGATPVPYALALGETKTGVTIFKIDPKVDTGEIVAQMTARIMPTDTAPSLLTRLFELGAKLLINTLQNNAPPLSSTTHDPQSTDLVFTHRLTRESGYLEWPVIQTLFSNLPVSPADTKNELLHVRIAKIKAQNLVIDNWVVVINDLVRALYPWPTVWTLAPTKKGKLRISLIPYQPVTSKIEMRILVAGKPRPIAWPEFVRYYLT